MRKITLDPRLEKDSIAIAQMRFCQMRLMQDARWPWLLLIPQREDCIELHDLTMDEQKMIAEDSADAARILKQITHCTKINTGALGNIVRQLHIHVIARFEGDANWPGPIWGFGEAVKYDKKKQSDLIAELSSKLIKYS